VRAQLRSEALTTLRRSHPPDAAGCVMPLTWEGPELPFPLHRRAAPAGGADGGAPAEGRGGDELGGAAGGGAVEHAKRFRLDDLFARQLYLAAPGAELVRLFEVRSCAGWADPAGAGTCAAAVHQWDEWLTCLVCSASGPCGAAADGGAAAGGGGARPRAAHRSQRHGQGARTP
jgi:hypothetical protein